MISTAILTVSLAMGEETEKAPPAADAAAVGFLIRGEGPSSFRRVQGVVVQQAGAELIVACPPVAAACGAGTLAIGEAENGSANVIAVIRVPKARVQSVDASWSGALKIEPEDLEKVWPTMEVRRWSWP